MLKEYELDWDGNRAVLVGNDKFRVVVERMDSAEAPDWDGMAYILSDGGYHGPYSFEGTTPEDSNIARAYETLYLEEFKRYLSIFHGMRDFRTVNANYYPSDHNYYVFDTAALRDEWGVDADYGNGAEGTAEEWQAYIDGDVYGVYVERAVDIESFKTVIATGERVNAGVVTTWEEYGDYPMWGLYGWKAVEGLNISEDEEGEFTIN